MQSRPTAAQSLALSVAVCCAVTWWIYYPGFISPDSIDQLREARANRYSDWHPPAFAYFWHLLEKLWPCQGSMLIVQTLAFYIGTALILWHLVPHRHATWMHLLIGLSPTAFALIGTVWKDVHLAAFLALGTGLALAAAGTTKRWWKPALLLLAALCLAYGIAVRHNGASALLPLLPALATRVLRRRSWLAAAAAFVVLVAVAQLAHRQLSKNAPPSRLFQYTAVFDLVGLSLRTGTNLLPPWLQEPPRGQPLDVLAETFAIGSCVPLFFVGPRLLGPVASDEELSVLTTRWRQAVFAHPWEYSRHRAGNARLLLGMFTPHTGYVFQGGADSNDMGCGFTNPRRTERVVAWHNYVKDSVFFRPWVLLVPSGLVFFLRVRRRPLSLEVALAASALCYVAPYLVLAQASDFRYTWWASVVGLLLVPVSVQELVARATRRTSTETVAS
jgi:hypothetical protein